MLTEYEMFSLENNIIKKVLSILRSGCLSEIRGEIEAFRTEIDIAINNYYDLQKQYMKALGEFNDGQDSLPSKLRDIKELVVCHSIGVQNVFDKFIELENRQNDIEDRLCNDTLEDLIISIQEGKDEETKAIGKGELLFHNKMSASSLIHEIKKQIELCENSDEKYCYRINWQIIYGKKFGYF